MTRTLARPWSLSVCLVLCTLVGCARKADWAVNAANGWSEAEKGHYPEAEQLLLRAAEEAQATGQTGRPVAQITTNLAWVYEKQGKHQEAATQADLARATFKDAGGDPDPDTARCLFTLGKMFHGRKRYADAEALYQQALTVGKDAKAFGPQHPVIAQIESELAVLYDAQQKFSDAAVHHAAAVDLLKTVPVYKEYRRIITAYENQAKHYRARGDFTKAATAHDKAFQAVKASPLRRVDPQYLRVQQGLASVYMQLGKHAEAYKAYEDILESFQKNAPKDKLLLAQVENDSGTLAYELKKYKAAKKHFEAALEIRRQELGDKNDLRLASTLRGLGNLAKAQGKWPQAEKYYLEALTIKEAAAGKDAATLAGDLDSLAAVERKLKKKSEAEELFKRSLEIRQKALGADDRAVASSYHNLANFYRDEGKYKDAEPLYQKALAIKEKAVGADSPQLVKLLENYSYLLRLEKREEEAKALKDRANALRGAKAQPARRRG
jgi:tetratricopeptide (TPR) repeat protein